MSHSIYNLKYQLRSPEFQNCVTVVSAEYLENMSIATFPVALLLEVMAFLQHQGVLVTA